MLNSRIQAIKPSATLAVKAKALKLRSEGRTIIDLSCGEPDIDTPEHIKRGAIEALAKGKTKYTDVSGIPELREALAQKLTKENGIFTEAASVVITNGGKQALYEIFDVTLEEGDEVIIPAPYWVSYPAMVEMCRGKAVIVPCDAENGYLITPDQLQKSITPRTKMVIINSPSNPTGMGYTKDQMQALGKVIAPHEKILVISDEVYEKITFQGFTFHSFAKVVPELSSRTLTVNAFSKTYSMTGWRVGYATGPKEIILAMGKHQSQTTSNVNAPAQYAALSAVQGSHEFLSSMLKNFERRTDLALELIGASKGLSISQRPLGAFYLFVRIDTLLREKVISGSTEFSAYLMENHGIAVVPGVEFGDDGAVRISTASSDEVIEQGVRGMCLAAEELLKRKKE